MPHDIHTLTAARIFNKNPEDVTPGERARGKWTNFVNLYGRSGEDPPKAPNAPDYIKETPK